MLFQKSIKFPNIFNNISGDTDTDSNLLSINRCIALLLTTAKGELLGDPDFGCNLYEMLFQPQTEDLMEEIKTNIIESITKYEKRVTINSTNINIELDRDNHKCLIHIDYALRNSDVIGDTEITFNERITDNG